MHAGQLYEKLVRAESFVELIAQMKSVEVEGREKTLIKLFGYLGLVETIGTSMVDFALLLLILDNRAFHIESTRTVPPIRHATSLRDFEDENISLGAKLGFLRQNNLAFLPKFIKRTLRNRIAHLTFEIDNNGAFYYEGRGANRRRKNINIDYEIGRIYRVIAAFKNFLNASKMLRLMEKATPNGARQ